MKQSSSPRVILTASLCVGGFNYSNHLLIRKLSLCVILSFNQAHLTNKKHKADLRQAS